MSSVEDVSKTTATGTTTVNKILMLYTVLTMRYIAFMHTMQELRMVMYARTTLYLCTLRKRNMHVLRLRYVNFFLAPTVI